MSPIEDAWKKILIKIDNQGYIHRKDDSEIKEIIDVHMYIKNPMNNEISPELGINLEPSKSYEYIHSISLGNYNIEGYPMKGEALAGYIDSISKSDLQGFVYTYPNRLLKHFHHNDGNDGFFINQLDVCLNRLKKNLGSNRAVAVLLDPDVDSYELDSTDKLVDDIPCWNWVQFLVRDDELNMHVQFRSNDIYNAFPANMMFLTYIGMLFTEKLNKTYPDIKFKGIYYNVTSAHYYTDVVDEEKLKEVI